MAGAVYRFGGSLEGCCETVPPLITRISSEYLGLAKLRTCTKLEEGLGKLRLVSNDSLHLRLMYSDGKLESVAGVGEDTVVEDVRGISTLLGARFG